MRGPGWGFQAVLYIFMFFHIFAVANIVNGVFVDGAIQLANQDRMLFIQKQRVADRAKDVQLMDLLKALDLNDDRIITYSEFSDGCNRKEILDYFSALHVDIEDAK